ncbi:hypothetical protein EDD86DRAFT_204432, partial [Gorgonomyces haynaldii]
MEVDQTLDILALHYAKFREKLQPNMKQLKEKLEQQAGRPSARDKLGRLSKQQFTELSTDVFDELSRRETEREPYLGVNPAYHPKRNQARQKLSTLPPSRFNELVSDVFFETDRRFPEIDKKIQQSMASKNLLPAEPRTNPTLDELPVNFASLDNLMADLGSMLSSPTKDPQVQLESKLSVRSVTQQAQPTATFAQPNGSEQTLVNDLRNKIQEMERELRTAREQAKASSQVNAQLERFKQRIQELETENKGLKDALQSQEADFKNLQEDFNEQQQIATDIRTEASNLLEEIRILSKKNETLRAEQEANLQKIKQLEKQDQSQEWQSKEKEYLRRIADLERSGKPPVPNGKLKWTPFERTLTMDNGPVEKENLDMYAQATKELVESARQFKAANVLMAMKSVVISCKHIVENIERGEDRMPDDDLFLEKLDAAKSDLSVKLTELMAVSKDHATQGKTSSVGQQLEDTVTLLNQAVTLLVTHAATAPSPVQMRSTSSPEPARSVMEVRDLKQFLEGQTDLIVQAIQSLLFAMRQTTPFGPEFKDIVNDIIRIVDLVIDTSSDTFDLPSAARLKKQGNDILDQLAGANTRLDELGEAMIQSPANKSTKQKLASSSYEIAKYVKELISLV